MWSSRLLSFVLTSLLVFPALGATITQSTQLTTNAFDYVIVGGTLLVRMHGILF